MEGKVCMVTGATGGIGQVTARALAEKGATVIVVGRNPDKGAAVIDEMKQQRRRGPDQHLPGHLAGGGRGHRKVLCEVRTGAFC